MRIYLILFACCLSLVACKPNSTSDASSDTSSEAVAPEADPAFIQDSVLDEPKYWFALEQQRNQGAKGGHARGKALGTVNGICDPLPFGITDYCSRLLAEKSVIGIMAVSYTHLTLPTICSV